MGVLEKITVDSATLARIEQSARAHGQSVEEEASEWLRKAAGSTRDEILARLDEIAALTPKGVAQTDSTLLVREDRDNRCSKLSTPRSPSNGPSTKTCAVRPDRSCRAAVNCWLRISSLSRSAMSFGRK